MRRPSLSAVAVIVAMTATLCGLGKTAAVVAQGNSGNGDLELAFNGHCRECHEFDRGDNRLGPTLYGVVGRKAGTVPGFDYSDSLKNSGITWDDKSLDQFIANPNLLIPGNNMGVIFSGLADAGERAKIIAFLKQDIKKGDKM